MDKVELTFTGTVADVRSFERSGKIRVEIQEGREYPALADVWCSLTEIEVIRKGDRVEVSCTRLPYSKTRTYTDRSGIEKTVTDTNYNAAAVRLLEDLTPEQEVARVTGTDDLEDDIPF